MLTSVTRLGHFFPLGDFLKPLATIIFPKSPTFLGNVCKGVKIIFLLKSFLGNFYKRCAIFSGHTGVDPFKKRFDCANLFRHHDHWQRTVTRAAASDAARDDCRWWRHRRRRAASPPAEKFRNCCFEFSADRTVDEEVAAGVDDEQAVVERREAEEPNRRSELWKDGALR